MEISDAVPSTPQSLKCDAPIEALQKEIEIICQTKCPVQAIQRTRALLREINFAGAVMDDDDDETAEDPQGESTTFKLMQAQFALEALLANLRNRYPEAAKREKLSDHGVRL